MQLKELEALLKMLRKFGVSEFSDNGVSLKLLADIPQKLKPGKEENIQTDKTYTDEDVMLWSAGN